MLGIKKSSLDNYNGKLAGKVSIIITNYKKEPYLKAAILSCLNQSYKDIEIIIVDDASNKDASLDTVRKIGFNNIRFIYTTRNYGHYMCCNYAMDKASGEFVTFLGGDDTLKRTHVEDLLKAIFKYKLVAALSLYGRYSVKGSAVGSGSRICEASILFRKEPFIRDIGYFHDVRAAGDTEYRYRALSFYGPKKIGVIQNSSYKALYLSDSLTKTTSLGRESEARKHYAKKFLKQSNIPRFDYKKDSLGPMLLEAIRVKDFDIKTFREIAL